MMKFDLAIIEALTYLKEHKNPEGRIDKFIELLENAKIKRKFRFNPIDVFTKLKASTTFSGQEIHLAHNWLEWSGMYPVTQARNLLHEAVHLKQYINFGNKHRFWWRYCFDKHFRFRMEEEARNVTKMIFGR